MSKVDPPPPPPPPIPPKRGGIHPQFGRFIGGAKLNDAYETVGGVGASLFRFSTQRRHEMTLASIEKTLRDARDSTIGIKFNGTLARKGQSIGDWKGALHHAVEETGYRTWSADVLPHQGHRRQSC